ncbi:MAG: DUF479 domain-containing protein [Chitinophagaceae bacterium]|nr:DUF479 domain-containing protein [Chitinophagaceae bacterium]
MLGRGYPFAFFWQKTAAKPSKSKILFLCEGYVRSEPGAERSIGNTPKNKKKSATLGLIIMNYLGHAVLSMGDAELLCGNMMGDFVKGGRANIERYAPGIQRGLWLHRHIDTFTDGHEAIREAKRIFSPVYGLYAGAVVDTVMDFFVGNDEALFASDEALEAFAQEVYERLGGLQASFAPGFEPYYLSMLQHNWLAQYRYEHGLRQALNGLMRKARHIAEMDTAYTLLMDNRVLLGALYGVFIKDVFNFVKNDLGRG